MTPESKYKNHCAEQTSMGFKSQQSCVQHEDPQYFNRIQRPKDAQVCFADSAAVLQLFPTQGKAQEI